MRIKVRGGTISEGAGSLCESCRYATVIRGAKLGDEIVECDRLSYRNQRVPFPVASCSQYSDRRLPTIEEMEDIAWVLRSDPRRKHIGFVRASRLNEDERHVLKD